MTCTTCGAMLDATATACPVCGAAAGANDPTRAMGATSGGYGPPPAPGAPWGGPDPTPHPSGLPSDVRNWGLAAHLSAFVGAWLLIAFVGPLVVWLAKRDDHPFIDHHAKEALNFNISFLLYAIVAFVLAIPIGLLTLGLGLVPLVLVGLAAALAWVILPIMAAVKAGNGQGYRYPLTIRFVR